jgi:hypothetical protein
MNLVLFHRTNFVAPGGFLSVVRTVSRCVMESRSGPPDPQNWELLSEANKDVYRRISAAFSAPSSRNKQIDDFREIIDAMKLFVNSEDVDKWRRSLVCGVFRLANRITVNIAQLKLLVFKCKLSINKLHFWR